MSSKEGSGLINSDLVFGYLLKNKSLLTVYLEDGTVLTGTILGKDDVFLLFMENTILHMIQIAKLIRLQAEVNVDSVVDLPGKLGIAKPKIIPALNEQNSLPPLPVSALPASGENNDNFKKRLDQLVRNW